MVKTMTGTLPGAVVLVVIGGAIWWLLSRDMAAGRWLLAALLIGHGVSTSCSWSHARGNRRWGCVAVRDGRSWAVREQGPISTRPCHRGNSDPVKVVSFALAALSR